MGSIIVEVFVSKKLKKACIDGLCVSKLQANLLLISKLLLNGLKMQFNLNECIVKDPDGEVIVMGLH